MSVSKGMTSTFNSSVLSRAQLAENFAIIDSTYAGVSAHGFNLVHTGFLTKEGQHCGGFELTTLNYFGAYTRIDLVSLSDVALFALSFAQNNCDMLCLQ